MQDDFDIIERSRLAGSDGPVFSPPIESGGITRLFDRWFSDGFDTLTVTALDWWQTFAFISLILSAFFLFGIIYSKIRFSQLYGTVMDKLVAEEKEWERTKRESPEHTRWRQVLAHAQSDNPNDWRAAIIEADIMLDETLAAAGFVGLTIGDKLKTATRDTFRSLDDAWEAHKIRNQIAHGGDFVLTKRATHEAMARYERVFQEFGAV